MINDIWSNPDIPLNEEQPFFTDTLEHLQSEDPTIGINGINWYSAMYPYLYRHKDRLVYRFNQEYHFREIGSETVSRWMWQLQNRFDEIAERFNHAYKMYEDEAIDLLGVGFVREIWTDSTGAGSASSTTSTTTDSKFRDTPTDSDSTINNPTTQDINTSEQSGESSSENSGSSHSKEKYDYNDEHRLTEINQVVDGFKSLDQDFINQFNQMFMGLLTII